ncbi:MAG: phytoene desaturase family protein [Dehalococcoidia bacterium]
MMRQEKYDVAVIGAGLGGLTAASLLSTAGYRTLVVEKLPFVGGRCSTLDYQGFKLPTGTVWVSEEVHGALCREVGAEFDIQVPDPQYAFRIGGKDYEAPMAGILRSMIGRASRDEAEAARVMRAFKRAITWCEPSRSITLYDWLKQYTDNPTILGIFQIFVAMDTAISHFELPAGEYFRFIKETSFVKNMGFLPHGGGSLTFALAKTIESKGNDIWTQCRALKILVEDGVVRGVVVSKDSEDIEVRAQVVVCNAGPHIAIDLAGQDHFDAGYVKDVEPTRTRTGPQIIIFVTSDRPLLEGAPMVCLPDARRVFCLMQYSTYCPEMAPKGKHLLEAAAFLTSAEPPYDLDKEIELCLQDLRDNIPNFDKYGQVLRVNCYHGYWGLMRTWAGYTNLPVVTPIEGLYNAGDNVAPSGWWGSSAAVKSGRMVAEDIIRRYKPA